MQKKERKISKLRGQEGLKKSRVNRTRGSSPDELNRKAGEKIKMYKIFTVVARSRNFLQAVASKLFSNWWPGGLSDG